MRRTSLGLAALFSAAAAALSPTPSASAVTQVDVLCESGASRYICSVYDDAQASSTVRWYINGVYSSSLDNRRFTGQRTCAAGRYLDVQVVVSDATGSVTGSGGVICNAGPWP
ncbi:hypothetical protein LZG04_19395 [Saccharothrix sp. S26]|uniref:hypothetical protein n=1 Tax=Saccharothrix sp. S26 TaxID=2907215 RepID=UPI001F303048|nr:hypothetical protein [Saccharothrix sp. S26]MCE6996951.1 hypothetical protein [Saccharothrix sp. S26]